MSVFKFNLFQFYVIHDDQMLINILKISLLELHMDSTIILLYQFLGKLKTVCLYPYFARQKHCDSKLGGKLIYLGLFCRRYQRLITFMGHAKCNKYNFNVYRKIFNSGPWPLILWSMAPYPLARNVRFCINI